MRFSPPSCNWQRSFSGPSPPLSKPLLATRCLPETKPTLHPGFSALLQACPKRGPQSQPPPHPRRRSRPSTLEWSHALLADPRGESLPYRPDTRPPSPHLSRQSQWTLDLSTL